MLKLVLVATTPCVTGPRQCPNCASRADSEAPAFTAFWNATRVFSSQVCAAAVIGNPAHTAASNASERKTDTTGRRVMSGPFSGSDFEPHQTAKDGGF